MQRKERNLHGEGDCEGHEQPASGRRGELGTLGELHEVEGDVAETVLCEHRRCNDADEHERGTEHRVEEELRRRIHALVVSPTTDEEVHRDENDLEEEEEEEEIEADEAAHDTRLEDEHPTEVALVVVVRVDTRNDEREEKARQNDEEERDAVDTDVPTDSPITDPRMLRHELESGVGRFERREQPDAETRGDGAGDQRHELRRLGSTIAREDREDAADGGHQHECGENRKRQGRAVRGFGGEHQAIPL